MKKSHPDPKVRALEGKTIAHVRYSTGPWNNGRATIDAIQFTDGSWLRFVVRPVIAIKKPLWEYSEHTADGSLPSTVAVQTAGEAGDAVPQESARCIDYRPDHNGECLNCDEPADGHWIENAAREIYDGADTSVGTIADAIRRHHAQPATPPGPAPTVTPLPRTAPPAPVGTPGRPRRLKRP